MKKSMFLILGILFLGTSCENNSVPVDDHNSVISLSSPAPTSVYHNGDTVLMSVHMGDEDDLHEGFLYIRTLTDTLFSFEPYVHELHTYDKDTFWIVNGIIGMTDATVTALDFNHVNGSDTAEVQIMLMP